MDPRLLDTVVIDELGWTSTAGTVKGVWNKGKHAKPLGQQCFWTARWSTNTYGQLTPERFVQLVPENIDDKSLLAEITDYCHRPDLGNLALRAAHLIIEAKNKGNWERGARKLIVEARQRLPNFTAHWDLPDTLMFEIFRPGWVSGPKPPQPEKIEKPLPSSRLRPPEKPLHPGQWRAKNQVTAGQLDIYNQRMSQYQIDLAEYQKAQKEGETNE